MSITRRLILREWKFVCAAVVALVLGVAAPFAWRSYDRHPMSVLERCNSLAKPTRRIVCMRDYALRQLEVRQIASVLTEFDHAGGDLRYFSECHSALHFAGRRYEYTAALTPELAQSILMGEGCSAGFMHGMLEQSVKLQRSTFATIATTICSQGDTQRAASQCFHALGHLLASSKGQDASERCAQLALRLPIRDLATTDCRNGIYMELAGRRAELVKDDRTADPRDLCAGVPSADVYHCYTYVPTVAIPLKRVSRLTLPGLIAYCEDIAAAGPALSGCLARATMFVDDIGAIDGCKGVQNIVAANICAFSIASERSKVVTPELVALTCSRLSRSWYGCAAGLGERIAWNQPLANAGAQSAAACASIADRRLADACRAGATLCWPHPTAVTSGARCRGARIPSPLRYAAAAQPKHGRA